MTRLSRIPVNLTYCGELIVKRIIRQNMELLSHLIFSPTSAQLICFKILTFTLKYTINASTCFGLTKPLSVSL
jgi:hypothetical protein